MSDEPKPKTDEGGTPPEDLSGLKKALEAERQSRRELERQIKAEKEAKDTERAKAEQAELERKGEWDKLKAAAEAEKAELAKKLQDSVSAHETHLKETKALTLLGPLAATPKTLESLKREFMDQLEVVQGKLLVKGDASMTPEKLAEKFKADPEYAPFLKGTGANGGGMQNPGHPRGEPPPQTSHEKITAGLKELGLGK